MRDAATSKGGGTRVADEIGHRGHASLFPAFSEWHILTHFYLICRQKQKLSPPSLQDNLCPVILRYSTSDDQGDIWTETDFEGRPSEAAGSSKAFPLGVSFSNFLDSLPPPRSLVFRCFNTALIIFALLACLVEIMGEIHPCPLCTELQYQ